MLFCRDVNVIWSLLTELGWVFFNRKFKDKQSRNIINNGVWANNYTDCLKILTIIIMTNIIYSAQ